MGPVLFADTYFFIARLWHRDPFHHKAIAWERHLLAHQLKVVTIEAVLWEFLNAFSPRATRAQAIRAYRAVYSEPSIAVIGFEAALTRAAVLLYENRGDKDWSVTDCLSFVVMNDHGLGEALTTDHHFLQAGFDALLLVDPP